MMHEWYWRAQWFWWAAAAAASASFVHVSLKGDLFLGFALKQEFNAFLFSFPSRENSTACKIESCSWPTVPKMNFELNWSLIGRVNVMLLFFIWGPKKHQKTKENNILPHWGCQAIDLTVCWVVDFSCTEQKRHAVYELWCAVFVFIL